jgi:hypothetical protein
MAKKKETPEPIKSLTESALKSAIEDLDALNAEYKELDKRYDALAEKILATMPVKDVRQYGQLRCTIIQAMRRTVNWKHETWALARKVYTTPNSFRGYLSYMVKTYKKKPTKASIKLSTIKTAEE